MWKYVWSEKKSESMINQCRLKILIQHLRSHAVVQTPCCLIGPKRLDLLGCNQLIQKSLFSLFQICILFNFPSPDGRHSCVWFCVVSFFLTPLKSQSVSSPVAWMPTVLLWVVWLSLCFAHIVRLVMPYSKRLPLSRGYLIVCGRQCFQESLWFFFSLPGQLR